MSVQSRVLVALIVVAMIIGLVSCQTMMSFNNACVELETSIKSQYDKNQAVYDTAWKSIKETASVADAHSDKLKEIVVASVQGRYANDQGVLFKAISESNGATLPIDLYGKVQQVVESSRQQFLANQVELVSKKQTYEQHLSTFPNTVYAGYLGFPRIKLDDYGIMTSERTDGAFKSKKDEAVLPFE